MPSGGSHPMMHRLGTVHNFACGLSACVARVMKDGVGGHRSHSYLRCFERCLQLGFRRQDRQGDVRAPLKVVQRGDSIAARLRFSFAAKAASAARRPGRPRASEQPGAAALAV
jgi:hypothetical protein